MDELQIDLSQAGIVRIGEGSDATSSATPLMTNSRWFRACDQTDADARFGGKMWDTFVSLKPGDKLHDGKLHNFIDNEKHCTRSRRQHIRR